MGFTVHRRSTRHRGDAAFFLGAAGQVFDPAQGTAFGPRYSRGMGRGRIASPLARTTGAFRRRCDGNGCRFSP